MKFTVEQHMQHLSNARKLLLEKQAVIARMQDDIDGLRSIINKMDAQIIEAQLRGVDAFDADKFGVKRNKTQEK
jgi:hypothetical protein